MQIDDVCWEGVDLNLEHPSVAFLSFFRFVFLSYRVNLPFVGAQFYESWQNVYSHVTIATIKPICITPETSHVVPRYQPPLLTHIFL